MIGTSKIREIIVREMEYEEPTEYTLLYGLKLREKRVRQIYGAQEFVVRYAFSLEAVEVAK